MHAWIFRTITILIGVAAAICCAAFTPVEVDRPSFRGVAFPPQWMPVILATGFLPVQSPDLSGVTTTPSPEKVSANARLSKENILHEIELIVNERPAVALRRSVAAAEYHIVAFNTQNFSHLVHTGVQTYRFTSTNGGYAPSGNETAGCTVETSEESDQVAGGFPDGLTVSQLSQQVRGQAPSARAPRHAPCIHITRSSVYRAPWLAARWSPGHLGGGDDGDAEQRQGLL